MWHGILHGVLQALHGNEKIYASHPARVKAHVFRVLASYPNGLLAAAAISLIGAALLLLLPNDWLPVTATVAGTPLIWFVAYVTEIRPWFREGDVCPGVVVCEHPFLVASITDMTTDLS